MHHYPYSIAESTNQAKQPYKYNGKELDPTHGLNLYDYSARYYDPAYGRFTSIDPLAEKYYNISPYVYCVNNPIKFIDPTGRSITTYTGTAAIGSLLAWARADAAEEESNEPPSDIVTKDGKIVGHYEDGENALYCAEELPAVEVYPNYGRMFVSTRGVTRIYNLYTKELSAPIGEAGLISVYPEFDVLFLGRGIANSIGSIAISSNGYKEASTYLRSVGLNKGVRKEILNSFEKESISLRIADDATYGLRFYGGSALPKGRYLFPTFTNYTNRVGLALPPNWNNTMSGLAQFQIKSGTPYIFGQAASQGGIYVGGSPQMFISNLNNLIP